MNIADIRFLYEYNDWANHRILAAAAQVTPEQYAAPADFPYGGLRGTLLHILDAEQSWRHQLAHGYWPEDLLEADYPTLAALQEAWQREEEVRRTYLDGLKDDDLTRIVRYPIDSGVIRERLLWHCLLHLANHGTQHRAEAAAMLTTYGCSPGDVDMTLFLNERPAATAA
jgi:uncharacterized damage-inducible protein DinB